MALHYEKLQGLWANVDRVKYIAKTFDSEERPYQFIYYITIYNESSETVTIVGRKWIVTNTRGHQLIIEGDGVVGEFPTLVPGEKFYYNSYHLIDSDSKATGAYLARREHAPEEEGILIPIPSFEMKVPSLHIS